jgi:hypothetical protein
MRKASVVMLVAMLIGGSLAVGAPAAFASPEPAHEGPQYGPTGPVAKFPAPAAMSGVLAGSTAGAISREHAELK